MVRSTLAPRGVDFTGRDQKYGSLHRVAVGSQVTCYCLQLPIGSCGWYEVYKDSQLPEYTSQVCYHIQQVMSPGRCSASAFGTSRLPSWLR